MNKANLINTHDTHNHKFILKFRYCFAQNGYNYNTSLLILSKFKYDLEVKIAATSTKNKNLYKNKLLPYCTNLDQFLLS